ncbi:MAG: efflux RND transporter periplasmic adaptor subunit [Dysgonomonas sp.]
MDREIPLSIQRKERLKQFIRYGAIIAVFIVIVIVIMNLLEGSVSSKNMVIATADQGTIEITIPASGKVMPLTEEIIVSPINSRILEVYKQAGDSVNIGDPILKLELATIETDYKQKLDEMEMKKSKLVQSKISLNNNISEMQMQLQVKEMKLKQLQTELKNEQYLDSLGASTADKVRQAGLNHEVAKLELQQLKQQIENQRKSSDAEAKVQQLDLSIFEKSLAESARLLNDARILSPQKATLTYVNSQIGSQVSAGTQIAIVSDLNKYKVQAEIADSYAEKLSPGAKAIIKISQVQLTGTIVNITPSVKNGVINFIVMLDDSSNSRLRSGLKTDVFVAYGIRDEVLRIPNGSYYIEPGEYDLWVVKDGTAEKRKVKLGEGSFEYVEVISGLELGEQVIISEMNQYKSKNSLKIK